MTPSRAEATQAYLQGRALYGDDFSDSEIETWFEAEQEGYYDLSGGHAQDAPQYQALDRATLFRFVRGRKLALCVALGSASGWDIEPLASQVDKFISIEPSRHFWRDSIAGKPAEYRPPALRGEIDLPEGSVDAVVAISVLHHIPNVSDVLREAHRILATGGHLLVREPICSMGDWREPRRGLTKNERGLPAWWLKSKLEELGFEIKAATLCNFAPLSALFAKFGIPPYQNRMLVQIDLFASRLTAWNVTYDRQGILRKFAPTAISLVAQKTRA